MPDKRFENFSHSLCTNDELVTAADQVCSELETQLSEDEFLTTERGLAKSESDTITTLKGRSRTGEFTDDIDLSDKKRDNIIRVIRRNLQNDIDMVEFDFEVAEAAKKVQKLMADNPVDIRAGYTDESAQINTLLSNSKASEYSDAIQENPMTEKLFRALGDEQIVFEGLLRKQAESNSKVPTGEVKKHVVDMMYRIDGILSYLKRKAESHGGAYETTAANIDEMLEKIMIPARARATKKAKERLEAKAE